VRTEYDFFQKFVQALSTDESCLVAQSLITARQLSAKNALRVEVVLIQRHFNLEIGGIAPVWSAIRKQSTSARRHVGRPTG
jgi:hypothetical protein